MGCSCQGRKGDQGATGAQGATGSAGSPTVTQVIVGSTSIPSSTNLQVIASAAQTANLMYFGQIQFENVNADGAVTITITPRVGGVDQTSKALHYTGPTTVGGQWDIVIPVSDLMAVTATDLVEFKIDMDDYTFTTTAKFRICYSYQ